MDQGLAAVIAALIAGVVAIYIHFSSKKTTSTYKSTNKSPRNGLTEEQTEKGTEKLKSSSGALYYAIRIAGIAFILSFFGMFALIAVQGTFANDAVLVLKASLLFAGAFCSLPVFLLVWFAIDVIHRAKR